MDDENVRHIVRVYVGALSQEYEALSVEASKHTTAEEIVTCIVQKLGFKSASDYELAEVIENSTGQECKERRIGPFESPVALKLLWPKTSEAADAVLFSGPSSGPNKSGLPSSLSSFNNVAEKYRFCLREKLSDSLWSENFAMDPQVLRDYFYRFLYQPKDKEYPDLCQLPDLNEQTLLENLKSRFNAGHIYSYVGSILIAINPFKFHPIYNPKYVKLYQNRRLEELPPHIFAIADSAYYAMLKERKNQCIVISGESGSGKTESTNFLLHHLTALSQKGAHGSGVEQTILSAGPVLEAFGNAKTAHNNNSSRFGKFIQVNYKENGMVHGAIVQKYLLEKSRICCQAKNERNYHVFYYLLAGASDPEKEILNLLPHYKYHYLNQSGCYTLDGVDESYEFSRLKQSMEMVGFGPDKQRKVFSVLSAVLLLGNVEYLPKKSSYHHDESVLVRNPEIVRIISGLLRVTEETLLAALTSKRARVSGEMLVINYRMPEAIAARDAMAKCLYGALFDWIVLQVNHALLSKKDSNGCEYLGKSIGVLDIFGFEDFAECNSFEQFCINYANEQLQHYFNQHVFKYEQEEYKKEGIQWTDIEFMDNTPCLSLVESRPNGLICILDDQCSFPGATNETLLQKFNSVHKENDFYVIPQKREAAFVIRHYAGKVKYQIGDFREKNMDLMRHDIVSVLKNSSMAFVRELVGNDPVAVFRWAIVRAFFRAYFAFHDAGNRQRVFKAKSALSRAFSNPGRRRSSNEQLIKDCSRSDSVSDVFGSDSQCSCPEYGDQGSHSLHFDDNEMEDFAMDDEKNRSFRPQQFMPRGMKNLHSVKSLASQTASIGVSNKGYNPRKQPVSVSQQFQQSLNSLMITLNQANPFFIRCIKSNSEKSPNFFDNETVQRQLRYTGMLETVRIRQAGYNVRLNFEEFIHLYRILLPKGLKSDRRDVEKFLVSLNLNPTNYQLGASKIFLRESEKIKLDYFLHQQIMTSIVKIQRWYRVALERRHFLRIQDAVIKIQSYLRMYLAQKFVANLRIKDLAATFIQKMWRGYRTRRWYENLKTSCAEFQARVRGNFARQKYQQLLEERRNLIKQKDKLRAMSRPRIDGDSHSGQSTDEAFLSKGSSQEELDNNNRKDFGDSDESSGVHEESDVDLARDAAIAAMQQLSMHHELDRRKKGTALTDSTDVSSILQQTNISSRISDSHFPLANETSLDDYPVVKERNKRKLSLKSRKEKGVGKFVEDDFGKQEVVLDRDDTKDNDEKSSIRGSNKNPFQKAKKHLKTFIGGTSKTKLDQHEAVLLDSGSEVEDSDLCRLNSDSSLLSNSSNTLDLRRMDTLSHSSASFHPSSSSRVSLNPSILREIHTGSSETSIPSKLRKSYYENKFIDGQLPSTPSYGGSSSRKSSEEQISPQYQSDNVFSESFPNHLDQVTKDPHYQESYRNPWSAGSISRASHSAMNISTSSNTNIGEVTKPRLKRTGELNSRVSSSVDMVLPSKATSMSNVPSQYTQNIDYVNDNDAGANKANRTRSIPNYSGSQKVRRTRSVSETRPSLPVSQEAVEICPLPYEIEPDVNDVISSGSSSKNGLHHLEKVTKYHRGDSCGTCRKTMHGFFNPGVKCSRCYNMFHSKCVQNGLVSNIPCVDSSRTHENMKEPLSTLSIEKSPSTMGRRKLRKSSKPLSEKTSSKFSVSKTSEFTDRTDQIISGVRELQLMQDFILKKIYLVKNKEGGKENSVDRVFQQALSEFKESLLSTYSIAIKQADSKPLNIRYKDLIANFATIMETVSKQKCPGDDFPTTMGVNAFRGFMNEFMMSNRSSEEKPKAVKARKERRKEKSGKRQKLEESINHLNHSFVTMVINIPTVCEVCSSFIMWPIERGVVCQKCKLACHKKCHPKILNDCNEGMMRAGSTGGESGVFGTPLMSLVSDSIGIPTVVENLVTAIELYGLRMEGLYRKSGVSSKVRELKQDIEDGKEIDWELYPVHVLTSVFKSFLREMPEPLLTFELYDEFLRAADLTQQEDRILTIFSLLKKLPKPNFDLMERLVFHLARVAQYEEKNRMNANSLAIVFAPCILRTNKTRQVQESLNDIGRQTLCIETIILSQLKKVRETLINIESLDSAAHSFATRLNSIRSSKMRSPANARKEPCGSTGSLSEGSVEVKSVNESTTPESMSAEEEEEYLTRHIKHLQNEKAILTSVLPSLSRTPSDEDLLSTDPEVDSPGGSVDDLRRDTASPSPRQSRAKSLQYSRGDYSKESLRPPQGSSLLHGVIKNRGPSRKPPSRFVRNLGSVNFGENEEHAEDDDSVLSVNQGNDDDAIMV